MKDSKKQGGAVFDGALKSVKANFGILIGFVVICAIVACSSPFFLTKNNIFNVLRQVSTTMMCASAMTMIIITGGIDLSVGAVSGLSSVLSAGLVTNSGFPVWTAVLCGLAVGLLVGAINGFILSRTSLPPFMVTYCLQSICNGAAYLYTNAQTIRVSDQSFINIGVGTLGSVPYPVIYMALIVFIVYLILNRTKLGRNLYAIGGNQTAATFAGINIKRAQMFVFMCSGLMAAFSGIIIAARSYSGMPTAGEGSEFDAIASVVLGGASMSGGYGRISGTVIGALIMAVLNNGMNLMGINNFWQYIVKGIVILIAIYTDFLKRSGAFPGQLRFAKARNKKGNKLS